MAAFPYQPEEDARILALVRDNVGAVEIGKALGRTPGSISNRINRLLQNDPETFEQYRGNKRSARNRQSFKGIKRGERYLHTTQRKPSNCAYKTCKSLGIVPIEGHNGVTVPRVSFLR